MIQYPWQIICSPISPYFSDATSVFLREHAERHLFVIGPYIPAAGDNKSSSYLTLTVEGMIEQCIRKGMTNLFKVRKQFCQTPQRYTVTQALYILEEYLHEKSLLQQYLQEVLHRQQQVTDFHRALVQVPSYGYITATQDTCLEIAYQELHHKPLQKFYFSTLKGALETVYENQPFIIKLYGDLENPGTLELNHRIAQYPTDCAMSCNQ